MSYYSDYKVDFKSIAFPLSFEKIELGGDYVVYRITILFLHYELKLNTWGLYK